MNDAPTPETAANAGRDGHLPNHNLRPRKFLVVIDDTPECETAVRYAALRAYRTNGKLVMLYVITPDQFQHWLGVAKIMREESARDAQDQLDNLRDQYCNFAPGFEVESVIREGTRLEAVDAQIEEDPDVAILVLAAGKSSDGPGPLVSAIVSRGFPIPVSVVPGEMDDATINALA